MIRGLGEFTSCWPLFVGTAPVANFLIAVDPDDQRRARVVSAAVARLAPVPGLVPGRLDFREMTAVWSSGPRAPVSEHVDTRAAALVWGEAFGPTGERVDASELRRFWLERTVGPEPFDGFHAGAAYAPEQGLQVGADLLGLFPVYYWHAGDVLLVGSSPECFPLHPLFRTVLDPRGLVGILLLSHLVGGRTLQSGVRRLGPGRLLRFRRGAEPEESQQFELPLSARYFDLPFKAHQGLLHGALERAVARHVPDATCGLMLSGGRDSRMLAGLLHRLRREVVAVTLGVSTDIEVSCARLVARRLGFDERTASVAPDRYPECVDRGVRWEHLAAGLGNPTNWALQDAMAALPGRTVTGYTMDAIVGGSHIEWAYDASAGSMAFDTYFRMINQYGLSPDTLRHLLRPEVFGDALDEALEQIRAIYTGYPGLESQRAWAFDLQHRQRFNVGRSLWPLAFGSWPVLPQTDREVLALCAGLPAASLAARRLQDEVLCSAFPELAELPLDRNSLNATPLRPSLSDQVRDRIAGRLRPLARVLRRWLPARAIERRYYFRTFDIDGPGWMAVRGQAEPFRKHLWELFDADALATLWPPPDRPMRLPHAIADSASRKLVMGLALWCRDHA